MTSIPSEMSIQRLNNDREDEFQLLQGPNQRNLRNENIKYNTAFQEVELACEYSRSTCP